MKTISWTLPKLHHFKTAYLNAVEGKKETFLFDGDEFLVDYAKYLIEYLEGKFNENSSPS